MKVLGILAVSAVILFFEARALRRKRERKVLLTFSIMMVAATALAVGQALYVPYPNPMDWVSFVFTPVGEALHRILS